MALQNINIENQNTIEEVKSKKGLQDIDIGDGTMPGVYVDPYESMVKNNPEFQIHYDNYMILVGNQGLRPMFTSDNKISGYMPWESEATINKENEELNPKPITGPTFGANPYNSGKESSISTSSGLKLIKNPYLTLNSHQQINQTVLPVSRDRIRPLNESDSYSIGPMPTINDQLKNKFYYPVNPFAYKKKADLDEFESASYSPLLEHTTSLDTKHIRRGGRKYLYYNEESEFWEHHFLVEDLDGDGTSETTFKEISADVWDYYYNFLRPGNNSNISEEARNTFDLLLNDVVTYTEKADGSKVDRPSTILFYSGNFISSDKHENDRIFVNPEKWDIAVKSFLDDIGLQDNPYLYTNRYTYYMENGPFPEDYMYEQYSVPENINLSWENYRAYVEPSLMEANLLEDDMYHEMINSGYLDVNKDGVIDDVNYDMVNYYSKPGRNQAMVSVGAELMVIGALSEFLGLGNIVTSATRSTAGTMIKNTVEDLATKGWKNFGRPTAKVVQPEKWPLSQFIPTSAKIGKESGIFGLGRRNKIPWEKMSGGRIGPPWGGKVWSGLRDFAYDAAFLGLGKMVTDEMIYYNPTWFHRNVLNDKTFEDYRQRKIKEIIEKSDESAIKAGGDLDKPVLPEHWENPQLDSLIKEIE